MGKSPSIFLAILICAATGCSESTGSGGSIVIIDDSGPPDSRLPDAGPDTGIAPDCPYTDNDYCDEPSRCALGSDEVDCANACAAGGDGLAFFAAACAHRDLLTPVAPVDTGAPAVVSVSDWVDEAIDAPTDTGGEAPRQFRIFTPPGLPSGAKVPMVLMLPGNRVSHFSLPAYTDLDSSAAANGFIVVYVEQPWRDRFFAWSWYTDWEWATRAAENPDLVFLRRLVTHLVGTRPVDPTRVYVAGHSRGAAMSVIAALEMPDVFAGAIPQSGFVEFGYFDRMAEWTGPHRPAFFFVHGALDDDVCIDCVPNGRCGVQPSRGCRTVAASDALVERLRSMGWDDANLRYARPERVAHRWQPWLNQTWWDFVSTHQSMGGGQ